MQRLGLVLVGGLLASGAVWADPPPPGSANSTEATKVSQHVAQNQAEIEHLQKDVGQQESASQQAAQRLQQQDRTIAELRQQLQAAQQAAKAKAAGH